MLSVHLCGSLIPTKKSSLGFLHTHHLFLNKIPIFHQILRIQPFPNSIYCNLQSVEPNPQTVKDYLDEQEQELELEEEVDLYTVNYLINACGLSEGEAINVAKRMGKGKRLLNTKRAANADDVLALLREYGFSLNQISMAVKIRPLFLMARPYVTILPKLEFLESIGFKRGAELGELVSKCPHILATSLKHKLIPNYNILKEVFDSNHEMIRASMKKSLKIVQTDISRTLVPNLEVLRDAGVSKSRIHYLVVNYPNTARQNHSQFRQTVIQLKKMEFDPSRVHFIYGIIALSGNFKTIWDRSYEVFLEMGCSRDEILAAFRTQPFCMLVSEEKINKVMECLVKEMGWPYSDIAKKPHLFKYSLEKRIIPRCSVVLFLHSKGLLEKIPKLSSTLEVSKDYFIKRYVTRYTEEVPEVLQIYEGELDFAGKLRNKGALVRS